MGVGRGAPAASYCMLTYQTTIIRHTGLLQCLILLPGIPSTTSSSAPYPVVAVPCLAHFENADLHQKRRFRAAAGMIRIITFGRLRPCESGGLVVACCDWNIIGPSLIRIPLNSQSVPHHRGLPEFPLPMIKSEPQSTQPYNKDRSP